MRKVTRDAVIMALALVLVGCGEGNGIERDRHDYSVDDRFLYERFGNGEASWQFGTVVDTETGITYLVFRDSYSKAAVGGITPLLDRDGNPVRSDAASAKSVEGEAGK